MFELKRIDSAAFNDWQAERHYLKRRIIRSKLLAHGVFVDNELVGGLLWATPHFTKKAGLFGCAGLLDKWEVLMLARFYLIDSCGVIASDALAASIGQSGRRTISKRRGWRLQEDWVATNPPRFPDMPFVPRLLISWSDSRYGHKGTIYGASGWDRWDVSPSGGQHTGRTHWIDKRDGNEKQAEYEYTEGGEKQCWIMRLDENRRAQRLGVERPRQASLFG